MKANSLRHVNGRNYNSAIIKVYIEVKALVYIKEIKKKKKKQLLSPQQASFSVCSLLDSNHWKPRYSTFLSSINLTNPSCFTPRNVLILVAVLPTREAANQERTT